LFADRKKGKKGPRFGREKGGGKGTWLAPKTPVIRLPGEGKKKKKKVVVTQKGGGTRPEPPRKKGRRERNPLAVYHP